MKPTTLQQDLLARLASRGEGASEQRPWRGRPHEDPTQRATQPSRMRSRQLGFGVALLVFVGFGATANLAAARPGASNPQSSESGSAVEEASQRFQRAVKLYRERSFDAALAEFNRAYELSPDYRVLYNLGQVQV